MSSSVFHTSDKTLPQNKDADTSFVIGPDVVMRTKKEHIRVFQRWLTGPGLTPVMTEEELENFNAQNAM